MFSLSLKYICSIVVCCVLAAISADDDFKPQPRVIGGRVAVENFPYIASIIEVTNNGRYHICGGSIINNRTILTAAHCIYNMSPENLQIHVGDRSLQIKEGAIYDVEAIYFNTNFTLATYDYDVGLIRVKDSIAYGPQIQPIKLVGRRDRIRDGSIATIIGWGYTDLNNPRIAEELMVAHVPIVNQGTCNRYIGGNRITKRMICAGYKNGGVDACKYDSGGPMVVSGKQVGIVSWGISCAESYKPGIYSRVSELLPWIINILHNEYNEVL